MSAVLSPDLICKGQNTLKCSSRVKSLVNKDLGAGTFKIFPGASKTITYYGVWNKVILKQLNENEFLGVNYCRVCIS